MNPPAPVEARRLPCASASFAAACLNRPNSGPSCSLNPFFFLVSFRLSPFRGSTKAPSRLSLHLIAMLRADNLTYRHGGRVMLDALDLQVDSREIVALVGPDAAEKTAAIECFLGLRVADAGCVCVAGFDVADQPRRPPRTWRSCRRGSRCLTGSTGSGTQGRSVQSAASICPMQSCALAC